MRRTNPDPRFFEFVCLMGFMMALISLSIDNLLPAFDVIKADLGIERSNSMQYLLSAYMLGFGIAQLVYGPVSDVIGRRPTLMIGLLIYCLGSLVAIVAQSFIWLLIARAIQGTGGAAARVLTDTIIRDRFSGRDMARTMSLTMMIFIVVQIVAPLTGQLTLVFGGWRLIFVGMLVLALVQILWFNWRMPETLHPEYRFPFSVKRVLDAIRLCLTARAFIGYSTAMALMMGTLHAYLGSSQAISGTAVYNLGSLFPFAFGLIAAVMGLASLLNSRLVRRFGMHRVSHIALSGFVICSTIQMVVSLVYEGHPPLYSFAFVLAMNMFLFSFTVPNFSAMALEPLGTVAGTASSLIGSYNNICGALLGALIGQAFDGTVLPLSLGFLALSALTLVVVLWTERWRLFSVQPALA